MKRIPLVTIPILAFIVIALLFMAIVPPDGDLISANGDMVLGQIISIVFIVFLIIDVSNFIKSRKKKWLFTKSRQDSDFLINFIVLYSML